VEAAPRTHERYEVSIRRFLQFLGTKADKDLTALRPDDLVRFRDNTARSRSTASTNMDLKVIRACLYAAQKQELLDSNVAAKVSVLKERGASKRRAFTLAEVKTILEQCDQAGAEWRGLVLTAVYTGQRLGDIARLTWQQVDLEKNAISFVTQKTGKRLSLSLAKPLQDYFERIPSSDDPTAFVFPKAGALADKHTGTINTKFYDDILAPARLVPVRPKIDAAPGGKGRAAKRKQSELSVAMRAKGDNRVSKRRQFVVSKRRLGGQKETNADALLCGLVMGVGSASLQPRTELCADANWVRAWRLVNNGSD